MHTSGPFREISAFDGMNDRARELEMEKMFQEI
jgi:hypothetical protein